MSKSKLKIIAVIFNTLSPAYRDKKYYYYTEKDFSIGQKIDVPVANGIAEATIVEIDITVDRKNRRLKTIK